MINTYLSTSRDGIHWDLETIYNQRPFLARGPNGSWLKDGVEVASNFLTVDDRHWIYFSGKPERHQFSQNYEQKIGLAVVDRDRFVALADTDGIAEGVITTKLIRAAHPLLVLNVDASQGSIKVEVITVESRLETGTLAAAVGFSRHECTLQAGVDGIEVPVFWHGLDGGAPRSIGQFVGSPIRLRFHLRGARLYALQLSR